MEYTFRPIRWIGAQTPAERRRSRSSFRASWSETLNLLEIELGYLDAKHPIIEADFREGDIRVDGMPRANARQPVFPGVGLAFDSRHGALIYRTDAHSFWQHNVRGIALSLQALRAVDRYGVTHAAEQYTGWRAIETGPIAMSAATTVTSRKDAAQFLAGALDVKHPEILVAAILGGDERTKLWWRMAARKIHPNSGGTGTPADVDRLMKAKEVLGL